MKTVMRANKQLRVPDDQVEAMEKQGYVQVDEKTGKPVKAPAQDPKKELAALKKENAELKKQNEELAAEVQKLTEQIDAQAGGTHTPET